MTNSIFASVLVLVLTFVSAVTSLNIAYCSSENTASTGPSSNNFQSNGLCQQTCISDFAFAIVLGKECWCSNFIPADTTSTSSCSDSCPGFPSDKCGNSAEGLYGYIALNLSPSGTAGSSSAASTSPSSTQETFSSYSSPTPTSTLSSTTPPSSTFVSSTITSSSSNSQVTVLGPVVLSTVTADGRTVTVSAPSSPAATDSANLGQSADHDDGGPSAGKIAGIVVGCVVGVAAVLAIIFLFWWRRRQQDRRSSGHVTPNEYDPHYPAHLDPTLPEPVRRHNSQMSQSGLLGGATRPTLNTQNLSNGRNGTSPNTPSSHRLSIPMSSHPVLDPNSIGNAYINSGYRNSNVSLNDNEDYSRKVLTLANPD